MFNLGIQGYANIMPGASGNEVREYAGDRLLVLQRE